MAIFKLLRSEARYSFIQVKVKAACRVKLFGIDQLLQDVIMKNGGGLKSYRLQVASLPVTGCR